MPCVWKPATHTCLATCVTHHALLPCLPCLPCLLALPACLPAGELQWQLLSTLADFHQRTIFTVDWSKDGLIASGCADNAVRIFGGAAAAAGEDAGATTGAEPGVRQLFMPPQQQEGTGGGSGADGSGSSSSGPFSLLCKREQAHPLDVNCVRWHPADPSLLASAGDDCCIRLWRWRPQAAAE